jgi:glycosyltransferase involved in cell wall biosynthesis
MSELVSIVVPMYNSARFIEKTIERLVSQTYSPVEIILVDDGSTDGTFAFAEELTRPFRGVRCYRKENGGVASARNYGIQRATGCYVAFCDHDDHWSRQKLARQVPLFGADPAVGLVYSPVRAVDGQGAILKDRMPDTLYEGEVLERLLCWNFIPFSSAVVRKACFDLLGGFREDPLMHGSDDRNMWIRLATRFRVRCCDEVLVDLVRHGQNYSDQDAKMLEAGLRSLADIWTCFPEIRQRDERLYRRSYSEIHRRYGVTFFAQGDYRAARMCMLSAARAEPWRISTYPYLLLSLLPSRLVDRARAVRRRALASGRRRRP